MERYMPIKSTKQALLADIVKIRELSQIYGENLISLWIQAWLVTLSSYMDFEITEQQSKITSMQIIEECYMFNLAELTLVFKRIIKGYYGIFYGKFNGQSIIKSFIQYRKERGIELSKLNTEEQKKLERT